MCRMEPASRGRVEWLRFVVDLYLRDVSWLKGALGSHSWHVRNIRGEKDTGSRRGSLESTKAVRFTPGLVRRYYASVVVLAAFLWNWLFHERGADQLSSAAQQGSTSLGRSRRCSVIAVSLTSQFYNITIPCKCPVPAPAATRC